MRTFSFRRCLSFTAALALALAALPAVAFGMEQKTAPTQIVATHVTIEDYTFPYTGQEVCPEVTVTVAEVLLEEDTHYTLAYKDNLQAGTASVTVTGIVEAGYEGIVTIPFTIEAPNGTLTELLGTHVTLEKTSYVYTGQPIVPTVTVKVGNTVLTQGRDYTVTCENNTQPGTATLTVEGIATASMTQGYTGKVTVEFTITEAPQQPEPTDPTEETQPSEETKPTEETKPAEETKPTEETKPVEETKPTEETKPVEETKPTEETKPVSYTITKGNKATWYQNSGKTLSFTADGKLDDFKGVSINGKALDESQYDVKKGTTLTLKTSYLNKLSVGKYTITLQFADGAAEGSFTVSDKLNPTNPVTGDDSAVGLWIMVTLGSLAALGGAAFFLRKKK